MKSETASKLLLQICTSIVGSSFTINEECQSAMMQIVKWLTEPSKPGLMIYGAVGTGKTMLAKSTYKLLELYKEQYRAWFKENIIELKKKGTYEYHDLRSDIGMPKARFIISTNLKDVEVINEAKKSCQIIILDDLGLEEVQVNNYGTKSSPFSELLSYRYEYNKPTIITTNLDDQKILERYGERIADRIHEMFSVVKLTGESYRRITL